MLNLKAIISVAAGIIAGAVVVCADAGELQQRPLVRPPADISTLLLTNPLLRTIVKENVDEGRECQTADKMRLLPNRFDSDRTEFLTWVNCGTPESRMDFNIAIIGMYDAKIRKIFYSSIEVFYISYKANGEPG